MAEQKAMYRLSSGTLSEGSEDEEGEWTLDSVEYIQGPPPPADAADRPPDFTRFVNDLWTRVSDEYAAQGIGRRHMLLSHIQFPTASRVRSSNPYGVPDLSHRAHAPTMSAEERRGIASGLDQRPAMLNTCDAVLAQMVNKYAKELFACACDGDVHISTQFWGCPRGKPRVTMTYLNQPPAPSHVRHAAGGQPPGASLRLRQMQISKLSEKDKSAPRCSGSLSGQK